MKPVFKKDYNANASEFLRKINAGSFDQIKLPGGTSADRSHYCGALIYRETEKSIELLVLPYNSEVHKTEESQKKPMNEHMLGTLYREIHEETGLSLTQEPIELKDARVNKPSHTKHFFLISEEKCKGDLLQDEINKFDPETGKPMWMSLEQLNDVLFFGHRNAVIIAVNELCKMSRKICEKAMNKFA
jgi:8-oxo-dGTP pyrophosphatase MutT (NUDIX family)